MVCEPSPRSIGAAASVWYQIVNQIQVTAAELRSHIHPAKLQRVCEPKKATLVTTRERPTQALPACLSMNESPPSSHHPYPYSCTRPSSHTNTQSVHVDVTPTDRAIELHRRTCTHTYRTCWRSLLRCPQTRRTQVERWYHPRQSSPQASTEYSGTCSSRTARPCRQSASQALRSPRAEALRPSRHREASARMPVWCG